MKEFDSWLSVFLNCISFENELQIFANITFVLKTESGDVIKIQGMKEIVTKLMHKNCQLQFSILNGEFTFTNEHPTSGVSRFIEVTTFQNENQAWKLEIQLQ